MRTPHPLKQSQHTRIYQASERTVRIWMKKGAPLDNPQEMLETFLAGQRAVAGNQNFADLSEVQARYRGEQDPAAEREAIRAEQGWPLDQLHHQLLGTRNFAMQYNKLEKSEQIVAQLNAMLEGVDTLFDLAGIGENFQYPETRRADLAKPARTKWTPNEQQESSGSHIAPLRIFTLPVTSARPPRTLAKAGMMLLRPRRATKLDTLHAALNAACKAL